MNYRNQYSLVMPRLRGQAGLPSVMSSGTYAQGRSAGEHLRRCRQAVACRAGCHDAWVSELLVPNGTGAGQVDQNTPQYARAASVCQPLLNSVN